MAPAYLYHTYRFVLTGTWIIAKVPSGVLTTANTRIRASFIATKRVLTVKFYDTLSVIITSLQRRQTYISVSCSENAKSRTTFLFIRPSSIDQFFSNNEFEKIITSPVLTQHRQVGPREQNTSFYLII